MAAIITRAKTLKKINPEQHKYLWMQMSSAGYRLKEPIELPQETPKLLDDIINIHFGELAYSIDDLSNILCLYREEFRLKYLSHYNRFRIIQGYNSN
jgi:hypothetical protein